MSPAGELIRRIAVEKLASKGYTADTEALDEVYFMLFDERQVCLADIISQFELNFPGQSLLNRERARRLRKLLVDSSSHLPDIDILSNVFEMPKFKYHIAKRTFFKVTEMPAATSVYVTDEMRWDRFCLLRQKLFLNPQFSRSRYNKSQSEIFEVSSVQNVIGLTGRRWVMGFLHHDEDWFVLEDHAGARLQIDLSNAKIAAGFFSDEMVVFAEGEMLNGVFQVKTFGFPPLEDRKKSVGMFPQLLWRHTTREQTWRFEVMGKTAVDKFIVLSDVRLDKDETMKKLESVLSGYEKVDVVPTLFVFMGDFCTAMDSFSTFRLQFQKLARIIGMCSRLQEQSKFMFIPGPCQSTHLPSPALHTSIVEEFKEYVPNAFFCSNPCRVMFCNHEIVFFRYDMLDGMFKCSMMPLSNEEVNDPFDHLVSTIIHQSHLCPLPRSVQPTLADYDHCLYLYPTPQTIVLGDSSCGQITSNCEGTVCFNAGSFSRDGAFGIYHPTKRSVEFSSF